MRIVTYNGIVSQSMISATSTMSIPCLCTQVISANSQPPTHDLPVELILNEVYAISMMRLILAILFGDTRRLDITVSTRILKIVQPWLILHLPITMEISTQIKTLATHSLCGICVKGEIMTDEERKKLTSDGY